MVERLALLLGLICVSALVVWLVRRWVAARAAARAGAALLPGLALEHPGAPTVVYFYGAGCPACPTQRAAIEALRAERLLNLVPIDAAADHRLVEWAGVLTVPSTALVDAAGRLQRVNHGFRSRADLAEQLALIA